MRIITVDVIAVNLPLSTVKLLMRFNSFELSEAFHTAAGLESEQSMIFHSFQFQKSISSFFITLHWRKRQTFADVLSSYQQSSLPGDELELRPCGCWTCLFSHNASNPSGSLGPGESQAQRGLAGLLPRGCWAAARSQSRPTSKPLIQRSPRLRTASGSDWHRDIKLAFCWRLVSARYGDAVLECCCKARTVFVGNTSKMSLETNTCFFYHDFQQHAKVIKASRVTGYPQRGPPAEDVTFSNC